ncbi:MAG: cytochrome c oxidase subunit 3 [Ardenticatenaceae bacterium]|nr:cytochrome c oxidase subunit 3 [Anaerolineales bacterium]MCB8984928.1 cytochrome c oxidase subunit 3 [Ardenticatenaceae bacterium]MCB8987817.1 cytochrome c oxidase subunit 3 [Ardenticatenaceae bacterium]
MTQTTTQPATPAWPTEDEKLAREREVNALGMWVFLASEIMLFGGLFLVYFVYRFRYPAAFAEGSSELNMWLGALNTAVLLTSSLTMALAVHQARGSSRKTAVLFMLLTMALGLLFLAIKGYEYWQDYQEGLVPGLNFTYSGAEQQAVALFLVLYFVMTALHALHLSIGIVMVGVAIVWGQIRPFAHDPAEPVEMIGLYWHFIDIVWVFLFPVLYLLR